MKNTDNLFTRAFLKSLTEAVAENPVADVESGSPDVESLNTPPVGEDDGAVAGAIGAAGDLAGAETTISNIVQQVELAGKNATELQSLSNKLGELAQQISAMMSNPATAEYAQSISDSITKARQKIEDKIAEFSDSVEKMNGGGEKPKTAFGAPLPTQVEKKAGGAAPAPKAPAEPAPEEGAPPA